MFFKMSVLQLGMEIQDAYGMVLLLETVFLTVTEALFGVSIVEAIREEIDPDYPTPWWLWPFLLAVTAKFILFFALIWFGFIYKGLFSLLQIWVILAAILDCAILVLVIVVHSVDTGGGSVTALEVILYFLYTILFLSIRVYIYTISWMAWKAVSEDSARGLRGYGQGFKDLFLQYKNEFQRVTVMLLTLEIIWNGWTALTIDIPLEIILHLAIGDSFIYRPIIAFRIPRLLFACFVLYAVKKKKTLYIKYSWFPFLLMSVILGIFLPVFVYFARTVSMDPFFESGYFAEIILSIFLNGALVYSVLGLAAVKPRIPVPFAQLDK